MHDQIRDMDAELESGHRKIANLVALCPRRLPPRGIGGWGRQEERKQRP